MIHGEAPAADDFDVNQRLHEMIENTQFKSLLQNIPQSMADLTKIMQMQTDIRVRERIKRMMKGLLDVIGADTKYPPQQTEPEKNQRDVL